MPACTQSIHGSDDTATENGQRKPDGVSSHAIPPFDNGNKAIDTDHDTVPLTYFNIVKLHEGESHHRTPVMRPVSCRQRAVLISTPMGSFAGIGNRGGDVWDGEPEGVYIPMVPK